MEQFDREKLSRAWIRFHHADNQAPEHDENFWAFTTLSDLCETDPESSWDVINHIRTMDGSHIVLANLAAGPLEELLVKHGPYLIDRVEALASEDPQFKKLLGGIWKNEIDHAVWSRLQRVSGDPF